MEIEAPSGKEQPLPASPRGGREAAEESKVKSICSITIVYTPILLHFRLLKNKTFDFNY